MQFELTEKVRSEINARSNRLKEVEGKKRSAVLEKKQAKEKYVQLVASHAEQKDIDKAYDDYQEKVKQYERYNEEYDIMSNSDEGFSVTSREFANKYSNEYVPETRETYIEPFISKLEELKTDYLHQLEELSDVIQQLEIEQRKAESIMNRKAFRDGENNNIHISISNVTHITNDMLNRAFITDDEISKRIGRDLI
jgi:hypothetical protein